MRSIQSSSVRRLAGLLAGLLLAACVVAPDQRHDAGGIVMVAPPAARVEIIGAPPTAGYVWMDGYWNWVGDRHEWVPGRWVAPHPGHHWRTYRWVRQGDGWHLKPGRWVRD
jgi:hypothetical protein